MIPGKYLHHVTYDYTTGYSTGHGLCEIYGDEPLRDEDREVVQRAVAEHNNLPAVAVVITGWTLADNR
ncbi:hypothetical protein [Melissospora conviva]|uniref:hypothetical protein n=1 Tax=Melissospora conviva TaxID=3388432 RepID=UPI003C284BC9